LLFSPSLGNYYYIFSGGKEFFRELLSTMIVSVCSTILVIVVSLPAAYSFARFNSRSGYLLFITISTRMFPPSIVAIPFFFWFKALGLLDTHFGLTMLYLYFNMSFAVFLLFGFFREIPEELEHAAMVDGYGGIAILRKIIFPLIAPGLAVTTIFCLVFSWNEFLFAFLFTRAEVTTLSIGLSRWAAAGATARGPMAGYTALAVLPTLTAAWFMQRYIIRGLTFGAMKG
jgi:multiple sugar transport system permease protein